MSNKKVLDKIKLLLASITIEYLIDNKSANQENCSKIIQQKLLKAMSDENNISDFFIETEITDNKVANIILIEETYNLLFQIIFEGGNNFFQYENEEGDRLINPNLFSCDDLNLDNYIYY